MCNAVQHVTGAKYERHLLVGAGTICRVVRYKTLTDKVGAVVT